ncbi:hypothetical protein, partial [Heyndrickxia faecalis]|uniref:hypothetical protein n=1 Tax=Heyndrickxia faecalis TaxID=2824910 RepID=UPI0031FCC342
RPGCHNKEYSLSHFHQHRMACRNILYRAHKYGCQILFQAGQPPPEKQRDFISLAVSIIFS